MNVDVDMLILVNDEDYQSNTNTMEILQSRSMISSRKDSASKGLYLKTSSRFNWQWGFIVILLCLSLRTIITSSYLHPMTMLNINVHKSFRHRQLQHCCQHPTVNTRQANAHKDTWQTTEQREVLTQHWNKDQPDKIQHLTPEQKKHNLADESR